MSAKLTKAQRALLVHISLHASIAKGGWYLRDMRRNKVGIVLEGLGLVERGWPESTGRPGHHRILMCLTTAGRAALTSEQQP